MNNKIIIFGVIALTIFLAGSYFLVGGNSKPAVKIASYTTSDAEKPVAVAKETLKDLGTIKVSDQKEAKFELKNTGVRPLAISNISSSCGCTVGTVTISGKESSEYGMHNVSDYVGEIAPGRAATVKVIYRPFVMPVYGAVEREVYVSTNDPSNQKLVFKVTANVK